MDQVKEEATEVNDRIGLGEYSAFTAGGVGIQIMSALIGSYLLIYMTNVAFLDIAVISTIIAVSRLLDGISDIIAGNIIDNTDTKLGRARTWLLRMILPLAVSVLLLFWVPPHFPAAVKYIYVFLMYNIATAIVLTFMQISVMSMVSLMSPKRHEQSILGNIVSLSIMVGGLVGNVLFVKLLLVFTDVPGEQNTQRAYTGSLLVYCAAMAVLALVMVLATRERVNDSIEKPGDERPGLRELISEFMIILREKYWLIMIVIRLVCMIMSQFFIVGSSYYALYVLGDMGAMSWLMIGQLVPSIIIMLIIPFFMKRINKRKVFIAGIIVSMIGTALLGLFGTTIPTVVGSLLIFSIGSGLFNSVVFGIIADIVTYTKLTTGHFVAGIGNAGLSAAQKLGRGLAGVVFGFVLSAAGFDAVLKVQPDAVITAIRFMYSWAPFICFVIVLVIYVGFFDMDRKLESLIAEDNKVQR